MVQIKPFDYDNTQFIVLVNGIDEIGEHMSLADAVDVAENELITYQGYTKEAAAEAVNDMIQDFL